MCIAGGVASLTGNAVLEMVARDELRGGNESSAARAQHLLLEVSPTLPLADRLRTAFLAGLGCSHVDGAVQVYSPGCPHCKALVTTHHTTSHDVLTLGFARRLTGACGVVCQAPTYSALARAVSAIPNLVVAKMDGTS